MPRRLYFLAGDNTEPHATVWRFGSCLSCGTDDSWLVLAVAKTANGRHFPRSGVCEACGHETDLKGLSSFYPYDVQVWARPLGVMRLPRPANGAAPA